MNLFFQSGISSEQNVVICNYKYKYNSPLLTHLVILLHVKGYCTFRKLF